MPFQKGAKIAEGKTKIIWSIENHPGFVIVESKDDITAGNGKKHDLMGGKALFSTAVTSDVFRLLQKVGVPLAFIEQIGGTEFLAHQCAMLPYEVVVRRAAYGSYVKRNPQCARGERLPDLVVEFFLKTQNKEWRGHALPCDDPLIVAKQDRFFLYRPDAPLASQEPFLCVFEQDFFRKTAVTRTNGNNPYAPFEMYELFTDMRVIAGNAFQFLEAAWGLLGCNLADFKVEFGFDRMERLVTADVIDPDSWRLLDADGEHLDKEPYRGGIPLPEVRRRYQRAAELSAYLRFA